MNITLVTETYPPEINGVAMTLQRLFTKLSERGHRITIVRPRQGPDDGPVQQGNIREVPVRGLPIPGYKGLHFGLPARGTLKKLWQAERPDVVHVATEGPLGWSGILYGRKLGIPVVSSFHTNFHAYGDHYGYGGSLKKVAYAYLRAAHNRTLRTYAPTGKLANELEHDGFKNLDVFGRGVDTDLFTPERRSEQLRAQWGVQAGTPVVIYVGRVADEKNIPLTIRAFNRLKEKLPDAKLVIVGDGPMRAKVENENPDFHFAGMRRGEDLAAHYASADAFLFASTTETFGNVVTEAMASGLVVLAYDYAAPQQYIKNSINGYLAPFDDADAYLRGTVRLAGERERWVELRAEARRTAMGLSWDSIVEKYENDLLEISRR